MNFLGKIFIVLLFIMSVLFMGAAVSVYGTHRDLKTKVSQAQRRSRTPIRNSRSKRRTTTAA